MRLRILLSAGAGALIAGCGQTGDRADDSPAPDAPGATAESGMQELTYPETKKVDVVDDYHGTSVPDPYRWLEQDVREAEDVRAWVEAQNKVSFGYLKALPGRDRIEERLTELWNFEKFGTPFYEGGRTFYFRNDGLQNQFVLYAQPGAGTEGDAEVVIDPNQWSEDGTIALGGVAPSPDGRFLAYGVQDGGSDWRTWKVRDLVAGEDLDDELEWIKFSNVAWLPDGSGFYYGRYPKPEEGAELQSLNLDMKVFFHRVGDPQEDDVLVYERPDQPEWTFASLVTDDGKWLVLSASTGTDFRNRVFVKDLEADGQFVEIVDDFEAGYALLGNAGATLYFMTTRGAPNRRIVSIDMSAGEDADFQEVVAESEEVAEGMSFIGGRFVVEYLKDAKSVLRVFEPTGALVREVELPGIGSVSGVSGKQDRAEAFFTFSSFNAPPTVYRYDVATGERSVFKQADVDFDPAAYEVSQVFYESKDGTRVPMFIARKRGLDLAEGAPTLLYGYGGFNVSVTPSFSISRLAWMEMGGVFALANIRGGGEYGEQWHKAGTRTNKQNVFDDFIAAAEHLIDEGYATADTLAVQGGSNGGLLVGAVVNQRPDLFAAALPAVGVMDMLRFQEFTAGRFWVDDYGSSDNPEDFEALYAYSPYHNLTRRAYPAILVTTADRDDRVVPGHSFKYAARLQEMQTGGAPVIIRIETRAGHGSGKPTEMIIEEIADEWAFLKEHLGLDLPADY